MIRFELYVVLYLLVGLIYYMATKHVIKDAIEKYEPVVQAFTICCFIVAWPIFLAMDAAGFIYFFARSFRRRE